LALIGAAGGTACAVASAEHPTAEADFQRFLSEADADIFRRTLENRLNAPRAACSGPAAAGGAPDAYFQIELYKIGMGCLWDEQKILLNVHWRVSDARTGHDLAKRRMHCHLTSARTVDAWFADPAYARKDIEQLLSRTAGILAEELLGLSPPSLGCAFQSRENGDSGAR
jgi:hypothetical protein